MGESNTRGNPGGPRVGDAGAMGAGAFLGGLSCVLLLQGIVQHKAEPLMAAPPAAHRALEEKGIAARQETNVQGPKAAAPPAAPTVEQTSLQLESAPAPPVLAEFSTPAAKEEVVPILGPWEQAQPAESPPALPTSWEEPEAGWALLSTSERDQPALDPLHLNLSEARIEQGQVTSGGAALEPSLGQELALTLHRAFCKDVGGRPTPFLTLDSDLDTLMVGISWQHFRP